MGINTSLSVGNDNLDGVVATPAKISVENDTANPIVITGLALVNTDGALSVGDFAKFFPLRTQTYSTGTAVTSSVPNWGTATQSTKTISNADLYYWVGNISGSTSSLGFYDGFQTQAQPSGSVTIAAGATASFLSSFIPVTAPVFPTEKIQTEIFGVVEVSGAVQAIKTTATPITIYCKPLDRVELSLVGANEVSYGINFAPQPAFLNFDAWIQTNIVFKDGSSVQVNPNGQGQIQMDFTSSNPDIISVNQSGIWSSTKPLTTLTNSVGSIYGGQNTELSGGAGALNFHFDALQGSPIDVTYVTIQNRLADGFTGSLQVGLASTQVLGFQTSPSLLSIASGTITDVKLYADLLGAGLYELTPDQNGVVWTSTNSTAIPVGVSGSVTGALNTQATAQIIGSVSGVPFQGVTRVTLNKT